MHNRALDNTYSRRYYYNTTAVWCIDWDYVACAENSTGRSVPVSYYSLHRKAHARTAHYVTDIMCSACSSVPVTSSRRCQFFVETAILVELRTPKKPSSSYIQLSNIHNTRLVWFDPLTPIVLRVYRTHVCCTRNSAASNNTFSFLLRYTVSPRIGRGSCRGL